jgi:DNA-directed RNA polymerase subunit RPC12/RpoP
MSKYRYEMGGIIRDTEIDFPYYTDEIIELLDEKDKRIAELEEQLKKFTEPKKVKFNKFNGYRGTRFKCPNCNKQIENCIDYTANYYCKHCGQRVVYPKFRVVNNVGELYFEEEG